MEAKTLGEGLCDYDPYANMPDGPERKDFERALGRMHHAQYLSSNCFELQDRELTSHALHSLAAVCDDLRACARALANKQMCLLQEEVAKPKAEW